MDHDEEDPTLVAFGEFVKAQRLLAQVSQRYLAKVSGVSDSYLSQVERGRYRPSPQVVKSLAQAFGIPASVMYAQLGLMYDEDGKPTGVEEAIRLDERLSPARQEALIRVYRSYFDE